VETLTALRTVIYFLASTASLVPGCTFAATSTGVKHGDSYRLWGLWTVVIDGSGASGTLMVNKLVAEKTDIEWQPLGAKVAL
jgi:hypothetical protein